jgi:hypothetical protein
MAYNFNSGDKVPSFVIKFLQRYRAQARIIDKQAYYKREPVSYNFSATDYMEKYQQVHYQNVIELSIAEQDLINLIDDNETADNLMQKYGPDIDTFIQEANKTLRNIDRENRIRANNPGVQLAWEKYQMMLKIAGGE